MENRSHALIAGFFTIALIVLATLLAIWLGRDKIQRTPYEIVTKSAVSGLNLQAVVRYKGIKVGNVTDIDFDDKVPGQIILRLEVLPDTPVTNATFATLAYQGVTGIAFVQLDEDAKAQHSQLLQAGASIARIPLRPGMLQNLEQRGIAILTQAEELTKRLNHMLDPDNQKSVVHTLESFGKLAQRWEAVPDQINPALQQLPVLMQQAGSTLQSVNQLSKDASQLTQNLTQFSTRLQGPDSPVFRFNQSLELFNNTLYADTLPRLNTLSNEARQSLRAVGRTAESLNERPQSILFGPPPATPGPGEPGFSAPAR
ncbi:MAG: MlaD family protein [Undibacterium curvum]|uniref:MlaD family protein n=1 Tax=Undibacterium curvum TaxID=2762294 RepID=UPI003BC38846